MAAKSKSAGAVSVQLRLRIVQGKTVALGPGKAELLQLVAETGSIGEAAKRMEMSYMRAWSLIQTMNESFKSPVIEAVRGGHARGGAELTKTGRRVLELYQRMEKAGLKASNAGWQAMQKLLRD